jgi:hypothetical protein
MAVRAARIPSKQLFSRGLRTASHQTTPALRNFFTYAQPSAVKKLPSSSLQQSALFFFRTERSLLSRRFRSLRFTSNKTPPSKTPNPTPNLGSPEPALTLSQRLKKLSREYGWSALGVYFALSALDFPFCFLAVRTLGTDRIGHYEHVVKEGFWSLISIPFPNLRSSEVKLKEEVHALTDTEREGDWGDQIDQAEAANRGANASTRPAALKYVMQ